VRKNKHRRHENSSSYTAYNVTNNTRDAEMHLTRSTAGNGVVTNQAFDPRTGLIQTQRAGGSGAVASFDYAFDTIGNLTARTDHDAGFSEGFCYDGLNRLTSYQITGTPGCPLAGTTVSYDGASMGNIVTKSDVGTYSYPSPGGGTGTRPHAVTGIAGSADGLTNPAYTYDGNGNMACVSTAAGCTGTVGRSVSYTAFNMADTIAQGSTSIAFTYDGEHHRLQQASTVSGVTTTTVYVNDPASGAMSEQVTVGGGVPSWTDYLTLDGQIVAQRNSSPAAAAQVWGALNWCAGAGPGCLTWTAGAVSTTWSWFVLDHLGSVAVVTDAAGSVVQRLSYDAWGMQRNPDGTSAACGSITSPTTRGYTNQEQVPQGCLVNLNARLYNAQIGRFMAADPVVGDDGMPGAFNRYSYVLDNPLSFSDPTGLCFLGCFWNSSVFRDIVGIAVAIVAWEVLPSYLAGFGGYLSTSSVVTAAGIGVQGASAALLETAGIAGGLSGAITTGTLKGTLLGAAEGLAFNQVGGLLMSETNPILGSVTADAFVAHGLVGGVFSVAQGANFGSGFLAAGFGTFAPTPTGNENWDQIVGGAAESAILGGAASVLGGGKFANGAETGAFGYLFNGAMHTTPEGRAEAQKAAGPFFRTMGEVAFFVFGGDVVDLARGALLAANEVASAVNIGRAGEDAVRAFYDIGSKEAINIGGGATRVADGLTGSVLSEVKNVQSLSFTQQLQDFAAYTNVNKLRFDLWIRSDTKLSGPLQDAISSGKINPRIIPGR
jgi:RHS repeat-associated protein